MMRRDSAGFRMLRAMDSRYAAWGLPAVAPPGLDGVWAKLSRARHHHSELKDAIGAYLGPSPYRITRQVVGDYETLRPEITLDPPIEIAMIFGDFLHALNSALDHTAWAFALTTALAPNGHTEWPLYRRRRTFTEATRPGGRLEHIPPDVLAAMRDIQPYQKNDWAYIGRDLAAMRDLWNEDKHRALPVVSMVVASRGVGWSPEGSKESGVRFGISAEGDEPDIV